MNNGQQATKKQKVRSDVIVRFGGKTIDSKCAPHTQQRTCIETAAAFATSIGTTKFSSGLCVPHGPFVLAANCGQRICISGAR